MELQTGVICWVCDTHVAARLGVDFIFDLLRCATVRAGKMLHD